MTVYFNYAAPLLNAKLALATEAAVFTSETYVNPNDQAVYQGVIDPGHSGTITLIDWNFSWKMDSLTASETAAWEWEYKAAGGVWVSLDTGNAITPGSVTYEVAARSSGILDGVSLATPIQFRLSITDADADWFITMPYAAAAEYWHVSHAIQIFGTV